MSETPASVAERHRALSSPTRVRVLDVVGRLGDGDGGVDAATVADALDLHPNTVRAHLEMLEKVGLVHSEFEERRRQGRPRRLFHAERPPQQSPSPEGAYLALAQALAGSLDDAAMETAEVVAAAGRRWGRELMQAESAAAAHGASQIGPRIVALLDRLGFAADPDPSGRIDLHRCPFAEVAREHPDIVCGLHEGILTGALEVLGSDDVVHLEPFVTPTTCAVWLETPSREID